VGRGTLVVNDKGFQVTIDQPLIQQVDSKQSELTTDTKKIKYSTGRIADSVVRQLEKQVGEPLPPDRFVGKNLVDKKAGFVLSSQSPKQWSIVNDAAGYTDMQRNIIELNSAGGATVKVSRLPSSVVRECTNVKCVVDYVVNILITTGKIEQQPNVSLDAASNTALVLCKNTAMQEELVIKLTQSDGYWYQTSAAYNTTTTAADTQADAVSMVTSFAVVN
jgi:hypothetical protein